MKHWKQKVFMWIKEDKAKILIIMIISLLLVVFSQTGSNEAEPVSLKEKIHSPDTFIPAGFVLVPIEIQNLQNVDSMIGNYGIVDIYNGKKAQPILTSARIIRSPLDPSQFAVMVSDSDASSLIVETHEPLRIVLQNPDNALISKNKIKSNGSRQIFIGGSHL